MSSSNKRTRRLLWLLHPGWAIALSLLSAALGVVFAEDLGNPMHEVRLRLMLATATHYSWLSCLIARSFEHGRLSLALGVAIGSLAVLVHKRFLGPHIGFRARFILMRWRERPHWKGLKIRMLCDLPLVLGIVLAVALAVLLRIFIIPALCGAMVPVFLVYPEQRAMYMEVRRLLDSADS